jgi:hypothetical protein
LGPAVIAFLIANLFDWPWHLAGADAIFALALGALAASSATRASPLRRAPLRDRQEGRS